MVQSMRASRLSITSILSPPARDEPAGRFQAPNRFLCWASIRPMPVSNRLLQWAKAGTRLRSIQRSVPGFVFHEIHVAHVGTADVPFQPVRQEDRDVHGHKLAAHQLGLQITDLLHQRSVFQCVRGEP